MARNEIAIILTAVDQASAALEDVQRSVGDLDSGSVRAERGGLAGLGRGLRGLISPATLAAGAMAGIGLAINQAVNSAAQFETALSNVATLGAHSSGQLEELRRGVLRLAPAVGEGPTQLTNALYDIVSAGYSADEALAVLEASAMAARAGLTDTRTAADAVTTALNAYGWSGREASRVTDVIQIAVQRGKTTWDEMGSSLGQVIPLAATAGVGFEELNAAIATATSVGIGTSQAITGLRAAISNIVQPSAQARQLAAELGIAFDGATLRAQGLSGILEQVQTATGGNIEQMAQLFGSVEALNTVLALTSDDGMVRFLEGQEAMQSASGATETAFEAQMGTLEAARAQYAAAMESIQVSIGSLFLPTIASATEALAGLLHHVVELFNRTPPLTRELAQLREATDKANAKLDEVADREQLLEVLDRISENLRGDAKEAWEEYAAGVRDTIGELDDVPRAVENARSALLAAQRAQLETTLRGLHAQLAEVESRLRIYGDVISGAADVEERINEMRREGNTLLDEAAEAARRGDRTRAEALEREAAALAQQLLTLENMASVGRFDDRDLDALRQRQRRLLADIEEVQQALQRLDQPPPAPTPRPDRDRPPPPVPDPERTQREAAEVVGLIARAEAELAEARRQWRAAETEEDVIFWARRIEEAEHALSRLRQLHEEVWLGVEPGVSVARPIPLPDVGVDVAPPRDIGVEPVVELLRLIPIPQVEAGIDAYLRKLAQTRQRAVRAGITSLIPEIRVGADVNALNNAIRTIDSINAATERGAQAAAQRAREERLLANALANRNRIVDSLASATERGEAAAYRRANEAASDYATRLGQLHQMGAEATASQRRLSLAIEPVVSLTNDYTRATLELVEVKFALGQASEDQLRAALVAEAVILEEMLRVTAEGSEQWYEYARALVRVRDDLERLDGVQQRAQSTLADYFGLARNLSDALGAGLGGVISVVESLITKVIAGDVFGAIGAGIGLVSALVGDISNGIAEVNRQIEQLAKRSRYLSEQLVRELAVTRRERRGGLLGWLGFTRAVLDEDATRAALLIGEDIASAIARGIRDGAEALERAINDILLQAAIESVILDEATQALIRAWVEAFQAGDKAAMERLREEFARIVDDARRSLIDSGLLGDTPSDADRAAPRRGGVQISEITGPTRDLFADLMSPLVELPVQTMLLRDIRDLMALPRPMAAPALLGPSIGTLNVAIHGTDPSNIGWQVINMIERQFVIQRRGVGR